MCIHLIFNVILFKFSLNNIINNNIQNTKVPNDPEQLDARKTRALTLENMKLTRELERFKVFQSENDHLKKELRSVKSRLEDEQQCRSKIQEDLEQYQDRVRICMESMDSVERQFESRDLTLQQLQGEREQEKEVVCKLSERLNHAEQVILGQKRELEKSLAAQKALIQQLQESEVEAKELQDFLQTEKGMLAEALNESDDKIKTLDLEIKKSGFRNKG